MFIFLLYQQSFWLLGDADRCFPFDLETIQNKYKKDHEKAKGHYLAGTLVDFPEVMRCGEQEKAKGLVRSHNAHVTLCTFHTL